MQFIDKVKLHLKAGNGGDGIVAFRREKYVPLGGPSGGDGGDGGSIIFEVDTNKSTLLDLRYTKQIKAQNGENGKNKKMYGADSDDVIVKVPLGTMVKDASTGNLIADLCKVGDREVICKGGKGGKGNRHYATSRNSAPEYAQLGESGEEKDVIVELKLLADVGLVGFPSVGKSTFLSVVSNARPEIADYPFTTLRPQLGLVKVDDTSFVIADLPGLIEGASEGKGLGHDFLKHIERCRVILHIVDMGANDGRDPLEDYRIIQKELASYPVNLAARPSIVLANKMDLDGAYDNLTRFKKAYPDVEVYEATTIINEGLQIVLYRLKELLNETPYFPIYDNEKSSQRVVYEYKEEYPFKVFNEGNGVYRVEGEKLSRLLSQVDFDDEDSIIRFSNQLRKLKVDEALREKGCKDGDRVYIEDFGFDFIEEE